MLLDRTYDDFLGCSVKKIKFDHTNLIGLLITYDDGCPDISNCIERFKAIDPHVRKIIIRTSCNELIKPLMVYRLVDGDWRTFEYKQRPRKHRQTH